MGGDSNKNANALSECSLCKNPLRKCDITPVFDKNAKTIFHVSCSKCSACFLVMLVSDKKGLVSMGIATDLDKDEVKDKLRSKEIGADEIIDAYQTVNSGSDGIKKLLSN